MRMSQMTWTTAICVCWAVSALTIMLGDRLTAAGPASEGAASDQMRQQASESIGLSGGGNTKEPPAGYAGYEQRKQRVIDLVASKPITDDDPVFEGGEIEARRALARLAKGTDLDGANDYFGNWGPRAVIHSDSEGKPSQYKNLLVIDTQGKPLKYAVLLGRDFEINETEGQWRFIKEGGAYAAIHSQGSLYLFELRLASDYGSFADFKKDIKDSPFSGSDPYTYTSTLGDTIEFTDRIIKVNGQSYNPGDYKLFDSPFVNSEWGSGYVVVRKGAGQLILDFRDAVNPKRILKE